ncbi:MAG: hypothetical protein K0S73_130 [Stenotrophomonas rhizophila]|jgi:hypothetical protein|nr:hypothetical protein [Stenotrophomonas rhizophila]
MRTSHPHTRAGATPCGVTLRSDGVWEKQAPEYPLIQVKQIAPTPKLVVSFKKL